MSYNDLRKKGIRPKKPIPIKSKDKEGLDNKWSKNEKNKMNIPYVIRMAICGGAGAGKTSLLKSFLLNKDFKRIYVISGLAIPTNEWNDVKNARVYYNQIPPIEKLTKHKYTAVVFDDLDIDTMSKDDIVYMNNIFKGIASRGLFACIIAHNYSDIPVTLRKNLQLIHIFKTPDLASIKRNLFQRVGVPGHKVDSCFELLKEDFDHITVDFIPGRPKHFAPIRFNNHKNIRFKIDDIPKGQQKNDDILIDNTYDMIKEQKEQRKKNRKKHGKDRIRGWR